MKIESITRWCDKIMVFSFCVLIYFAPISIALTETFTNIALFFYLLKRTVIWADGIRQNGPAWTALSVWKKICHFFRAYKPVANCLNLPIAVLLIYSFISVLFSPYHAVSLKGFLGKELQNAFLYFNFIECFNTKERLKKFLTVLFISFSVVGLSGFYQSIFGRDLIFGQVAFDHRIASSFRAPNDFGAYLILVIPVLLSLTVFLWWEKKRALPGVNGFDRFFDTPKMKIWLFLLLLLAVYDVGLTYSRGAWLGLMIGLLFFGISSRQIWKMLILIIVFIAVSFLADKDPRFIFKNIQSFLIDNGRIGYWREALDIIKHHPLFGVGLNTYSLVGRDYKIAWGGYPHNCYLQMAAETGLVGLGIFLWMVTALFRNWFQTNRTISAPSLRLLQSGFAIGLLGFLIHGFFDTVFYSVQLGDLMWIYMGVIVAVAKISRGQNSTS